MQAVWRSVKAVALLVVTGLVPSAAWAACAVAKYAEFPITMAGGEPQVQGKINGQDANFIINSRSGWSFISPGAANQYGLKLFSAPQQISATEGKKSVNLSVATVQQLNLAATAFHDVQFLVGGSEVREGAGSIGQNFLHGFDVEYDLAHAAIRLLRPKGCGAAALAYWAGSQPFSDIALTNNAGSFPQTEVELKINGQPIHAVLSTAATASVLSVNAARRLGLFPAASEPPRGSVVSVANIQIAGEQVHNARLRIDEVGETDMIIGGDFFLAHRIYVANSQDKMYFTYAGGRFFGVGAGTARAVDAQGKPIELKDAAEDPKDADGFSRRGMIRLARDDAQAALADLDRAVELAAADARFLIQRAEVYGRLQKLELAEADIDKALAINPDNPDALIVRARLMRAMQRPSRAEADLDSVSKLIGDGADMRFQVAVAYMAIDHPEKAIPEFNRWISAHPADHRKAIALNNRCWARALLDRELPIALQDCDAALKIIDRKAAVLDSRGLVCFRMGDLAGAIKDYDAALDAAPGQAITRYLRGVAKLKLGKKAEGEKDLADARAFRPGIDDMAKRWSIAP